MDGATTHLHLENPESERAVEALEAYLEHHPSDNNALCDLALIYFGKLEDKTKAFELFERIVENHKQSDHHGETGTLCAALQNIGLIYQRRKQYSDAYNAYIKAYESDPAWHSSGEFAAQTLWVLGKHDEAIDLFRKLLQDHPSLTHVRSQCAYFLARTGELDEARTLCREVESEDPTDETSWKNLAKTYEVLSETDQRARAQRLSSKYPRPDRRPAKKELA